MTKSPQSDDQKSDTEPPISGSTSFWAELKRRKVMRVAITYAVVAWLIMQVAGLTFEGFGVPIWAFRFVVIVLWLFFPVAIILTWAFELTPEGIKTTRNARENPSDIPVSKTHLRKRNWMALGFAAALPTVVFGALALYFYATRDSVDDVVEKSIAVLPLENMSPDENNAFFADGVQEDILTNLSKIEELDKVISRSSTLQFRNPDRDLKQVGEQLGVRYLVEGSVRRAGNQVRVTVQLIDALEDDHVWAETYNRTLDDIFVIQAEVAKEIASRLKTAISPIEIQRIERRPTTSQEAYDYFVKAREESRSQRLDLLEKAIALDPEFTEAWARFAVDLLNQWRVEKLRNDPDLLARAHHALAQVERLGPNLPDLPWVQSYFVRYEQNDFESSIEYLLKAIAIDPSFIPAQSSLAYSYSRVGRLPEAQFHYEAALRNDPLTDSVNFELFNTYAQRRMWDETLSLIQLNLKRSNNADSWRSRLANTNYLQSGDKERYIIEMEEISSFIEGPKGRPWKALMRRDYETALKYIDGIDTGENLASNRFQMNVRSGGLWLRPPSLLASLIWFELGDRDKQLSEATKARTYLEWVMEEDPRSHLDYKDNLMVCYALEGDHEKMEATNAQLHERIADSAMSKYIQPPYHHTYLAISYLVLGDTEAAIEHLIEASKLERAMFVNRELDLWFIFDRLRGNPRFDALLEG